MPGRSFWEKVFYKYEYIEQIEKNGQIYKKYKKRSRFLFFKENWRLLLYLILLMCAVFVVDFFLKIMQKK